MGLTSVVQNVDRLLAPIVKELSEAGESFINDMISKLEESADNMRLGVAAGFVLIRTQLDDVFDDLEEKHVPSLMDSFDNLVPVVTSFLSKRKLATSLRFSNSF